jgi:predicted  nucleic acid-binding Zn-ribbon protein
MIKELIRDRLLLVARLLNKMETLKARVIVIEERLNTLEERVDELRANDLDLSKRIRDIRRDISEAL